MTLGEHTGHHYPPGSELCPWVLLSCRGPVSTSHGMPALAVLTLSVIRVD